jgi:signal transduction histidine kinase
MRDDTKLRQNLNVFGITTAPKDTISGGGKMGDLIRRFDWSKTQLGPIDTWPQSLVTTVNICLSSRFPMQIWWGPQLVNIYNDAYIPIAGTKHPHKILGCTGFDSWGEVWDIIYPMFEDVRNTGEATWSKNKLLLLHRNGYLEEAYFTWSYSPILIEDGSVGGILTTVAETTDNVLQERRLSTLHELAVKAINVQTVDEACRKIAITLSQKKHDLPFVLFYLFDTTQNQLLLKNATGFDPHPNPFPAKINLSESSEGSPLKSLFIEATTHNRLVEIPSIDTFYSPLPVGVFSKSPHLAVAIPLESSDQTARAGVMLTGINPCLALDKEYRVYLELVAGQISRTLATAQSYEEGKRRLEMLAEIDKAKTVFFSNVSHEFRTPLTLMIGPLEDSLSDTKTPLSVNQQERQQLIYRNTLRLLKLVNSLLDFSRIEANRIQAIFEPTEVTILTADLASVFRSTIEKAGLKLIVDTSPLDEMVYIDKEMWEKIIFNLLSNAFKFTLNGEIKVVLKKYQGKVQLSIQDTGVGIPEKELPRLFERFHRIEGSQGRSYEGTGIGLALVQELVKLHGGIIQVTSQTGVGTTFTITIPFGCAHLPANSLGTKRESYKPASIGTAFVEEALRWLPEDASGQVPKPAAASSSLANPSENKPGRILLADDNSDMRQYVKNCLSAHWEVDAVENGEVAFESALRHAPDLVLSDVMMPKLNGFELIQKLRANPSTRYIPIILLSARAGEEARVEGLKAGADDYVVKPFSAKELLARIHTQLELGRLRTQLESQVKQRTQQLQQSYEALQSEMTESLHLETQLAEQRKEIIKTICHELRSPLNVIFGVTSLIRDNLSVVERILGNQSSSLDSSVLPKTREVFDNLKNDLTALEQSSHKQKDIVDGVLDPTRPETDVIESNPVPFCLNETFSNKSSGGNSTVEPSVLTVTKRTILIVEDNVLNQKILANYLKQMNCLTQIANNGKEAIEKYDDFNYDLILMDIEMPIMNGLEATRQIREKEKLSGAHTPIVGISANALKDQIEKAIASGMDDYITKPFHKEDIEKAIGKYCDSHSAPAKKEKNTIVREAVQPPPRVTKLTFLEGEGFGGKRNTTPIPQITTTPRLILERTILQSIFEQSDEQIVAIDVQFKFILLNPAAIQSFTKQYGKVINLRMSVTEALANHPEHQLQALNNWRRALRGESFTSVEEVAYKNKATHIYEVCYSPVKDTLGNIIGASTVTRDKTAQLLTEKGNTMGKGAKTSYGM